MLVDPMTESLPPKIFVGHVSKMRLTKRRIMIAYCTFTGHYYYYYVNENFPPYSDFVCLLVTLWAHNSVKTLYNKICLSQLIIAY